jgi:hypothetical protein
MSKEEVKKLIDEAISDLEVAENHLNYVDKEYVDVAILEVSVAMKKLEVATSLMNKIDPKEEEFCGTEGLKE